VVNISYRLAPAHRFPAAVEDCAAALGWLLDHADDIGADRDRLVFAGESAGANLVTALALMCCYEREEPFARDMYARSFTPRAVMPYCGMLQVSDAGRFLRRKPKIGRFLDDRLREVSQAYLGDRHHDLGPTLDLADPLTVLERGERPARPLPPFFATVGTADPLLDDTRRLCAALSRLDVPCETLYYPRQVHAFHALVWREEARRCWRDSFRFLDHHLGGSRPAVEVASQSQTQRGSPP
jgi:acetyl esterase